ncbi:hypothetical protein HRbin36_02845 [bacterium HR36]|nr:hypothetical protein HRbin36_02845 [bacterium HR36]
MPDHCRTRTSQSIQHPYYVLRQFGQGIAAQSGFIAVPIGQVVGDDAKMRVEQSGQGKKGEEPIG